MERAKETRQQGRSSFGVRISDPNSDTGHNIAQQRGGEGWEKEHTAAAIGSKVLGVGDLKKEGGIS